MINDWTRNNLTNAKSIRIDTLCNSSVATLSWYSLLLIICHDTCPYEKNSMSIWCCPNNDNEKDHHLDHIVFYEKSEIQTKNER